MAIENPLRDVEHAAGASLQSYGGIELPEKYTDPMAECVIVRASAGLVDLSFRSRLAFTGPDRTTFLHNLLSNDILRLRPGGGCYTTILTQQSKIVADANVFCAEEAMLLDVDARLAARAREHLDTYLIADDVEVDDRAAAEATLGIHGPRSAEILRRALGGGEPPEEELGHRVGAIGGAPVRVARVSWTGDPGFDVWLPREAAVAVWTAILAAGESAGLRPVGMLAFDVLRLEAGIAWPGVDFDESHLVLEAGLERGISFTKGCYLGQEMVERQSARGHVNRRLVGLRIQGRAVPRSGARILRGGEEVGQVTSAAFSPTLGAPVALGYVRREVMEPGNRVEAELGTGSAQAEIVATPFRK